MMNVDISFLGHVKIAIGAMVVAKGEPIADLYCLIGDTIVGDAIVANAMTDSSTTWHKYLGHMSKQGLKVLSDQNLLPGLSSINLEFCENCLYEKFHRASLPLYVARNKGVLELIWEAPIEPLEGSKYFVSFINNFSRKASMHMLKKKSNAFIFKFKAMVENENEKKIKCLQTDNGGEYTYKEFIEFCIEHDIKR